MERKEYSFEEDEKLEAIRKEEISLGEKMAEELLRNVSLDLIPSEIKINGEDVLKGREAFSKAMSERFGKDFEPYKE